MARYILVKQNDVKLIEASGFRPQVEGADALFPYKEKRKISSKVLADISHNLAVMLQSGLDILDALATAIASSTNAGEASLLYDVRQDIIAGSSLSDAFSNYSDEVHSVFLGVLRAGEQSGNLGRSLFSVEQFYRTTSKMQEGLNAQMIEPFITMVAAVGISFYLIGAVFPNFQQMALSMGAELGGILSIYLAMADYLPILIVVAAIGLYLFFRYRLQILSVLPVVGPAMRRLYGMLDMYSVAQIINIGFASGLPLPVITNYMVESVSSKQFKEAMKSIQKDVEEVKPLSEAFANTKLPPQLKAVVKVGERSGNMRSMAEGLAQTIVDSLDPEMEKMQRSLFIGMTMLSAIIVTPILLGFYMGYFGIFQQLMGSL